MGVWRALHFVQVNDGVVVRDAHGPSVESSRAVVGPVHLVHVFSDSVIDVDFAFLGVHLHIALFGHAEVAHFIVLTLPSTSYIDGLSVRHRRQKQNGCDQEKAFHLVTKRDSRGFVSFHGLILIKMRCLGWRSVLGWEFAGR
jgi:hypothetical protein